MIAAVRLRYRGRDVPRCPTNCRTPEDRLQSGCDAPSEYCVFRSTCPTCLGGSADCPACQGVGKKEWHRCPAAIVSRDVWELLDSYAVFDAHGTLPVQGGWMDQSRAWVRWRKIIDMERAAIEEENKPRKRAPAPE